MRTARLLPVGAVLGLCLLAPAATAGAGWFSSAVPDPGPTAAVALPDGRVLDVMKQEVSWTLWKACHDDGGCEYLPRPGRTDGSAFPVAGVNALDVEQFLAWINRDNGTWRLPTIAEWRIMAAELPRKKRKPLFDDPRLAWAADYGAMEKVLKPVRPSGHFGAFTNGVEDLGGNVWEWTSTCSDLNADPGLCPAYVVAGLHEADIPIFLRDPSTGGCAAGVPPANLSFRLVRDRNPADLPAPASPSG
jgi:formylglycine-generating enzyme required for sulfatase activity